MKIIVLIIILFLSSCGNRELKKEAPKVKKGILDLSNWNFKKDGHLNLEGSWLYYWKKEIGPKDILEKGIPKGGTFIKVPGNWKGDKGEKVPVKGYATYLLKIKGLKKGLSLALDAPRVFSSYKVHLLDGSIAKNLLTVGKYNSLEKKSIPQFKRGKKAFTVESNTVFLIINISNYHFRNGKIDSNFKLGLKEEIDRVFENKLYKDLSIIGFLLFSFIYHLGLYTQRREDKAPLYFGLFCGVVCLRNVVLGHFISWFFGYPSNFIF